MYIGTMISFDTSVRIARPVDDVFTFLADPTRFPVWNSAVTSVRRTSATTYAMRRELPTGRAENELEVVELAPPSVFAIRTTSGPTPFTYRYALTADAGGTVIALDAEVSLGLLGPIAARAVGRGVDANLATLRDALERAGG
jgi:uncharacterized protein YndB with AHSA1/START domain